MGIFSDIVAKLIGKAKPEQAAPASPPATSAPETTEAPIAAAALADVDVEEVMDQLVAESGQALDWRTSIVDAMKALGIDSSLAHRKQLAQELQFNGDTNDSAAMNLWLHKRLMATLASNGGRLPASLTA